MIKSIKVLTTLLTIILLSSFTDKKPNKIIGTYGVTDSNPSQIKLTINRDNTFYYQDFSNNDKKISINGHWTLKGKKVCLSDDNSANENFHKVWEISENGQVAKSQKGLTFYRLCKIEG